MLRCVELERAASKERIAVETERNWIMRWNCRWSNVIHTSRSRAAEDRKGMGTVVRPHRSDPTRPIRGPAPLFVAVVPASPARNSTKSTNDPTKLPHYDVTENFMLSSDESEVEKFQARYAPQYARDSEEERPDNSKVESKTRRGNRGKLEKMHNLPLDIVLEVRLEDRFRR